MHFLLGLPGQIQTLLARWTQALADKLNTNLDTTVSSRAPSSTALSTATWTAARAVKLDSIDATVSSRAAASTALSTATWTATRAGKLDSIDAAISTRLSAAVKSFQTGFLFGAVGSVTGSQALGEAKYLAVTIASVNTAKCLVMRELAEANGRVIYTRLASSTELRIGQIEPASYPTVTGRWSVIEFY